MGLMKLVYPPALFVCIVVRYLCHNHAYAEKDQSLIQLEAIYLVANPCPQSR